MQRKDWRNDLAKELDEIYDRVGQELDQIAAESEEWTIKQTTLPQPASVNAKFTVQTQFPPTSENYGAQRYWREMHPFQKFCLMASLLAVGFWGLLVVIWLGETSSLGLGLFSRVFGSVVSVAGVYVLVTLQDFYVVKTLENTLRSTGRGAGTYRDENGTVSMPYVRFRNPIHIVIEVTRVHLVVGSTRTRLIPVSDYDWPVEKDSVQSRYQHSTMIAPGKFANWGIHPRGTELLRAHEADGVVAGFEVFVTYKSYFGYEQHRVVVTSHSDAWHLLQTGCYMSQMNEWQLQRLRSKYPDMTI